MPIYEYACKKCGHTLDALQKMSDDPLVDCPQCRAPDLKRLISAPRFRLKGQGWYETDFKKDNKRNLSSSDGEPAKKEKTESKPEKSADSKPKSDSSSSNGGNAKKTSASKDSN